MSEAEGRAYCTAGKIYLDESVWTAKGKKWKRNVYKQCKACIYRTLISCPTFNPVATTVVRGETYRETRDYISKIYPEEEETQSEVCPETGSEK